MSTWGKIIGAASITTGVVAAAALGGVTAQRRAVRRHRSSVAGDDAEQAYDALVSDRTYSVVGDDGTVLHVDEAGPRDAPITLIFAHGWTLRSGSWHYQRLALAGTGSGAGDRPAARMVFYDQRSHGKSSRAGPGHSTLADLAEDLAAVIATAAPEGPLVLIGHSMGGMAIITLAGRHPDLFADRVVGIGLVSTSAGQVALPGMGRVRINGGNPLFKLVMSTAARYPQLIERGREVGRDAAWLLTRTLGFARKDIPGDLVDFLDEMISATPLEVIAEFAPALMSLDAGAALPAMADIPTVIICGDSDRITPVERSRDIAEALPRAELVVVAGAGHMANLEAPEVVNAALERMLVDAADRAGIPVVRKRVQR